mgnify:CR=1 FL=1
MKLLVFCISILLCSSSLSAITRYVTPTGAGAMNGTSWANAFPGTSLQAAINASAVGDEVWVAYGTYNPPLGQADPRNNAFSLRNGVAVYGGFQGTETSLAQRRIICGQASILSGEIGALGNADNCYHVIRNGNLDASAIIDGFTIRDANNSRTISTGESGNGGGIYNGGSGAGNNSSPTIRNCIITQNTARYGGGIFNNGFNGGTVNPTISQCIIANNTALEGGGGIDFFTADGGNAAPTLFNTIVCNNTAQNVTGGQGAGGMYLWGGNLTPSIINCVFANNTSAGIGGGIIIDDTPLFGGVSGTCNVIVQNSIFQGNTAVTNGPQFSIRAGGSFTATYSFVDMAAAGQGPFPISGAGTGNIVAGNPNFLNAANPIGADGCWFTADDGLQLQNTSPCINSGSNSGVSTTDLWGVPRIVGGTVDIGAYEYRALTISSFTPTSAGTGAAVIITGSGFIGTTSVSFGGTPAASFSIDSDTQITATLAAGASGNVEVTAAGTATLAGFTFLVAPMAVPPTLFSAATPPAGTTNTPYSYQFVANGNAPQTYSVQSGILPSGLSLSAAGVLSGTPLISGTFGPIVVRATNGSGFFDSSPISITINTPVSPPPQPVFTFPTISGGTFSGFVGIPLGIAVNASGNPPPGVSMNGGTLPPGLSLVEGSLRGIPTQTGSYSFILAATNSVGTATALVTVNIGPAVPLITGVNPSSGTFGSTVTISGYNLSNASAVSIGGVAAQSFRFVDGNVVATVGAGGTGSVNISTPLGSTSGGSFTFILPETPILSSSPLPTIQTGDENFSVFLAGRNIPPFVAANITPLSSIGAVQGASIPMEVVSVSETGATLIAPVAARLTGIKRLTLRVADILSVSTTFAIVAAPPPMVRQLTVSSTTASGSAFTTTVFGLGFFRFGFARIFINGEEDFYSTVLDSSTVRVQIPAKYNVRGGTLPIRILNYDGQSTEATVRIISRNAPFITSVTPRRTNGNLSFIVRGVAFSSGITAVLGRRQVTILPGGTDTEFEILVPSDFEAPIQGTVSLLVENPDGQRYGFLIGAPLFLSSPILLQNMKEAREIAAAVHNSESAQLSKSNFSDQLNVFPNPVSETLVINIPAFEGTGRLSILNARGEEILSELTAGNRHTFLDVRSLVCGTYFVRIVSADLLLLKRISVMR